MMKLIFLGAGAAFTIGADNYQSNMLLVDEQGHKLLIDCGSDIRFSLYIAGFSYLDITDIYISHLHADHVGGLEFIGFNNRFDPRCEKPNLYLSKDLVCELWEKTLSGGMRSVEGDILELSDFFTVHGVDCNGYFSWQGIQFHVIRVIHVNNGYFAIPSYGLFFEAEGQKVLITTDTQFSPDILGPYYEQADIIFQDCETAPFPSRVHAHYKELLTLPESVRSKMWLYHYQPGNLPDAVKDGFCGFVKRGQEFEILQFFNHVESLKLRT